MKLNIIHTIYVKVLFSFTFKWDKKFPVKVRLLGIILKQVKYFQLIGNFVKIHYTMHFWIT